MLFVGSNKTDHGKATCLVQGSIAKDRLYSFRPDQFGVVLSLISLRDRNSLQFGVNSNAQSPILKYLLLQKRKVSILVVSKKQNSRALLAHSCGSSDSVDKELRILH